MSGYVRLLQSQYESKSARTVLKIISLKSGGLFLVNARPFPEHSSSIATFSAGRAWLVTQWTVFTGGEKWPPCAPGGIMPRQHTQNEWEIRVC